MCEYGYFKSIESYAKETELWSNGNEWGVNDIRHRIENHYREILSEAIDGLDDDELLELWNEYSEDEKVCYMSDIDDTVGRVYLTEAADILENVDLSDNYYREYFGEVSGSADYVTELIDVSDLVDAVADERVSYHSLPAELVTIVDEFETVMEDLQEYADSIEKRKQAVKTLSSLVEYLKNNGTTADIESAITAIWNNAE